MVLREVCFPSSKTVNFIFYCTALTSVAIGDVRKAPPKLETMPWTMCLITIMILSTVAFAVAAYDPAAVQERKFGWSSVTMVVTAVLTVSFFRTQAGLL
jgi:heme/copper-type cytochrome/quinol oxidase subunit 3